MASAILTSIISIADKLAKPIGEAFAASTSFSGSSNPDCCDVQEDLRNLTRTLPRIQAMLADAEEREIRDCSVQLWLRELRSCAYEADDVLDDYRYELQRLQMTHKRKLDEFLDPAAVVPPAGTEFLRSIAARVRAIREMFDEISAEKDALHLREEDGERRPNSAWKLAPTSSLLVDSTVFGRETDKKKIVELLMAPNGPNVISIVGMGGLGKTTLAQLIYNDERVRNFFSIRAWICVSHEFDVARITKEIIISAGHSPGETTELARLQQILTHTLKKRRFLLVLDDVCNERPSLWELLRAPFGSASLSKVIITTRSESVTKVVQNEPPYRLSLLSDSHCQLLLRQYAFRSAQDPLESARSVFGEGKQDVKVSNKNSNLSVIADKIAMKCKGLPLAAKMLGSLLCGETDEERWQEVLDSKSLEMMDERNEILPVLRLSYQRMPPYLKQCFTYCAVFPKAYVFARDYAVKLWISQSFIGPNGRRSLEDIGMAYFDELVQRSLFQPSQLSGYRDGCFIMHDLIHDLAKSVSSNECALDDGCSSNVSAPIFHISLAPCSNEEIANGRQRLQQQRQQQQSLLSQTSWGNGRQRLIRKYAELRNDTLPIKRTIKLQNLDGPKVLRTLLVLKPLQHHQFQSHVEMPVNLFQKLTCLRSLDLSNTDLDGVPDSIGGLKHLRYLSLRETNISTLPESLCNLYNLQVLDLDRCEHLSELPKGFGSLTSLRHLKLPVMEDSHICMPPGMGNLTDLQTLSAFYVGGDKWHCGIGELGGLENLKSELRILGLERASKLGNPVLTKIKGIRKLILCWHTQRSETFNRVARKMYSQAELSDKKWRSDAAFLLDNLQPHTNVAELIIQGYTGTRLASWMGDPSFSKLTSVKLDLSGDMCTSLPSFGRLPSLKHLAIGGMNSMKIIGHEFCGCCASVPVGFQALETLELSEMRALEEWHDLHGTCFPCLRELCLASCPLLRRLPCRFSSSLAKLEIYDCQMLPTIPKCPMLASLKLWGQCNLDRWWSTLDLPKLVHLEISNYQGPSLELRPNLPMIKWLTLESCAELKEAKGLHHLQSLWCLEIRECPLFAVLTENGQRHRFLVCRRPL